MSKYLITNDGLELNPDYKEGEHPEEKKDEPEVPKTEIAGSKPPKDWKGWLKLAGSAIIHTIFPDPEEKPKPPGPTYTVTRHNDGALTVTIRP